MVQSNRRYLFVALVAAVTMLAGASQADACWGCGWGGCYSYDACPTWSACYTPCYTTCWEPYCGDSWYLGYRPGPIRRWLLGPYRWYYAGGAGCYWGACYTGCCVDDCGGYDVWTEGDSAAPDQPTPAPAQPTPADAPDSSMHLQGDSGLLTVWVPARAKVFINGAETSTVGSRRRYVSHGLKPGLVYKYEVRVELIRDGKLAEDTKVVYLTAGAEEGLAFGFNRKPISEVAALQ